MVSLNLTPYILIGAYGLSSGIETRNYTVITPDALDTYLTLSGTIISILSCYPRSPLTKEFFSAIIEDLFFCRNGHEDMVLQNTTYPITKDTVTGCAFTTKGILYVINVVTSTPPFNR